MKKETKIGLVLMFICTIFTAFGQLFLKYGSLTFEWNIIKLVTNYNLIYGLFFYGIGALLLLIALKYGDLSTMYPLISLTFIWVLFISIFVFNEVVNSFKINAVILIIFGVILIAGGDSNG